LRGNCSTPWQIVSGLGRKSLFLTAAGGDGFTPG
jgi:hypothetical protein